MEGVPKFKPVSEGPNGNHLERVPDAEVVPGELTPEQGAELRETLCRIDAPNIPQKKS
jgi:hypothetical protein